MTILKINIYPINKDILRTPTVDIVDIDNNIKPLIDNMITTMLYYSGVGLAANQIGINKSIIVYNDPNDNINKYLINPKIIKTNHDIITSEEACLSLPFFSSKVNRKSEIIISAIDINNNPIEIKTNDKLSIILQHEIDHLNGKLFVDYLSKLKYDMCIKRILKRLHKKIINMNNF